MKIGNLFLCLVSAGIAAGMFLSAAPAAREAAVPRSVAARPPLTGNESNVVTLFENTAPSVAYIYIERQQRISFFEVGTAKGAGSGFVWDTAGHVVTNYHVVENASSVQVQLDSGKPIAARVVGIAPEYDLAVVQLKEVPKDLRPIPLGSSHDLKIGQSVYAIGNPFGLSRTLTTGIVSALDRSLPTSDFAEIEGVIQTDAAINPGNSGGPLLDSAGRLIGVNSAIRSESGNSAGVGFAIPADMVNRVVPRLIATGRAPRPGIGIVPANPLLVARAGISGVVVQDVNRGSPADQEGLKALDKRTGEVGDVIVGVNGRRIDTLATFVAELDRVGIGNVAELTVSRDGKERKLRIKVADMPR
ncbi:MAG: trypsin-like peptidase domain-containing protein [Burkholderiaceae bacterium]|nr:trypsin-like peptidase domain-containing protein [Burkholderiaceae bacterium]